MNIQELATEARKHFETATRSNGETFWKRKDSAPDWVGDLCMHAHEGMLPDDYRYEFIVDSLDLIKDEEDFEDQQPAHATADLTAWLASSNSRLEYCDNAESGTMFERLQFGHHSEYEQVYRLVCDFLSAMEE